MKYAIYLTSLLLLNSAFAAEDDEQWYTVEILVFSHLNENALDEEYWSDDPGIPDLSGALEITRVNTLLDEILADEPIQQQSGPVAFALLGDEDLQLLREKDYMRRSRYYRPLLHVAWRQPGFSKTQARPVHLISGLDTPVPEDDGTTDEIETVVLPVPTPFNEPETLTLKELSPLEGTVRLYRQRYLHLEADLLYARQVDLARLENVNDSKYREPAFSEDLPPSLFRLRQSRRFRSGEIHYFDNPLIAMLAQVRKYELPEPEPEPEEKLDEVSNKKLAE